MKHVTISLEGVQPENNTREPCKYVDSLLFKNWWRFQKVSILAYLIEAALKSTTDYYDFYWDESALRLLSEFEFSHNQFK